jgi:hypothetical protein
MDEKTRELIQLYIDGRLTKEETQTVEALIRSEKPARKYYKGLIAVQNKVKRLEHQSAFQHFSEKWPKRVRSEHEKKLVRRRMISMASSMAAVAIIAVVGFSMYFGNAGLSMKTADSAAPEAVTMMESDESVQAAMLEQPVEEEALMQDSEPAADMAGSDEIMDGNVTSDATNEKSDSERSLAMPENAYVVDAKSLELPKVYDDLLLLSEGSEVQPEVFDDQVRILVNDENYLPVIQFMQKNGLVSEGLVPEMVLVLIFNVQ